LEYFKGWLLYSRRSFPKKRWKTKIFPVKRKTAKARLFFWGSSQNGSMFGFNAARYTRFLRWKGQSLLIGEAAGFISPSSLEGISYALNSAYELAKVFNSGNINPIWKISLKLIPMKIKLLLKYLKLPFMYHPFLRKLIMKTGFNSINVTDEPNAT
ncbi:MAG: hypothetical protein FWD67_01715, partial [Betaproteobacteria bacterium]|nr:hypothetical protein [Betaproteobacteria bacterium]